MAWIIGQVLHAARQAFGQELAQPALEELDIAQHPIVGRDRNVVARSTSRSACTASAVAGLGGVGFKGFDREQRVDGGRLGLGFREAVAGGQRRLLEHADAVDQPIEMLTQARIRAGAVRRFQQRVERAIELGLGALEVPEREFLLAGFKMPVGRSDQDCDGIGRRRWRRNRCRDG